MNCAVHADQAATGYCRNCGKPLCASCTREVRGAMYCEDCIAGVLSSPQAPVNIVTRDTRPGTALALGFIPGLGAIYNGEYLKALVHVLIFASLIAMLQADIPDGLIAMFGVMLGCFYLYMPIEAYQTAKARSEGGAAPLSLIPAQNQAPIGAIVLIGLGALLLLANFGLLDRDWFTKSWPLVLVAFGVYLVYDRMTKKT